MKKLVVLALVCSFAVGCSSWRKKSDAAPEGGVVSETTGAGSSEKVDSSPMNYAATGSDSGSIAGLSTVTFEYDKSTLSSGEKAKLQANIQWLKKNASAKMLVEGHCDQRGSTEYNLSLGERRANAVKKMLVDGGIASARLSTVSYGKEKLLATGDSEGEMAKNRRANFVPSSN